MKPKVIISIERRQCYGAWVYQTAIGNEAVWLLSTICTDPEMSADDEYTYIYSDEFVYLETLIIHSMIYYTRK